MVVHNICVVEADLGVRLAICGIGTKSSRNEITKTSSGKGLMLMKNWRDCIVVIF